MNQPLISNRYRIKSGLGKGAMGSVYLAFDEKMGRDVAVKILDEKFAKNPKHRQRFEREARAIAALHHPNVVEIYDYSGDTDDTLYLVMEVLRGENVGELVRGNDPMPESILGSIGVGLAAALNASHQAGIIHRDLKPENVFVDQGRVVLGDFGIAKAIALDNPFGPDAASAHTDVIGTPGFMAPEQFEQQRLDARADIFAFGSLLYYAASQQLAFDADSPYALLQKFKDSQPIPLGQIRPDLSDAFCALVHKCLEVDRDFRPSSIEAVRQNLRETLDAIGAGDTRELLTAFIANPGAYELTDRDRSISHLIGRLKIAVRDMDQNTTARTRRHLERVAPNQTLADRITGVDDLLKHPSFDTIPEDIYARDRKRRRFIAFWTLTVFASILAGVVSYTAIRWSTRLPPPPIDSSLEVQPCLLNVRANAVTLVRVDEHFVGRTPNFSPVLTSAGTHTMVFSHKKRGDIKQEIELPEGAKIQIFVDWRKKKLDIKITKEEPGTAN